MLWGFNNDKKNKAPINVAYERGKLVEYETNPNAGSPLFRVLNSKDFVSDTLSLTQWYSVSEILLSGDGYYEEGFLLYNFKLTLEDVSPSNYAYVLSYEPIYNSANKIERVNLFIYSTVTASAHLDAVMIKLGTIDEW